MKTLSIKNVPDDIYFRLQAQAQRNHRSMNGEVIAVLNQTLPNHLQDVMDVLEQARRVRAMWTGPPITIEEIQQAIDEGRP